ncbi:uncharacterized protein LOC123899637 isoform X3 [Trifolium pratense]|uniref:uncharacterized protein LOC123899637 isoform X3 n=1 Tax=Trifolium pratense TaxID=57577 RepID=UPI001E692FD3|nr:uncharacterized protein LOC123899637 isoform X3 [Trifolium pratense]
MVIPIMKTLVTLTQLDLQQFERITSANAGAISIKWTTSHVILQNSFKCILFQFTFMLFFPNFSIILHFQLPHSMLVFLTLEFLELLFQLIGNAIIYSCTYPLHIWIVVDYTVVFVFRLLMFVDNGFAARMVNHLQLPEEEQKWGFLIWLLFSYYGLLCIACMSVGMESFWLNPLQRLTRRQAHPVRSQQGIPVSEYGFPLKCSRPICFFPRSILMNTNVVHTLRIS